MLNTFAHITVVQNTAVDLGGRAVWAPALTTSPGESSGGVSGDLQKCQIRNANLAPNSKTKNSTIN